MNNTDDSDRALKLKFSLGETWLNYSWVVDVGVGGKGYTCNEVENDTE